MALNQQGNDLIGQAKYEPQNGEPWNGEVTGYVSGNQVHLAITTALEGNKQASSSLDGAVMDYTINGKYFISSKGKMIYRGDFSAALVNPKISDYTPAAVTQQPVTMGWTKLLEVYNYADKIGPGGDLSGNNTSFVMNQTLTNVSSVTKIDVSQSEGDIF